MKHLTLLSSVVTLASALPQAIDFAGIKQAGAAALQPVPYGAGSQSNPYNSNAAYQSTYNQVFANPPKPSKRGLTSRTNTGPCDPQPSGVGPVPSPDTPDAFLADPDFSNAANNAIIPTGYTLAFQNLSASVTTSSYLGYDSINSYDPSICASACSSNSGCLAFNLFFERDPTQLPADACPNPNSTTIIKCSYWGVPIGPGVATNTGGYQNDFKHAQAGSNGYNINSAQNVPGYNGTFLNNAAINEPCSTYIGYEFFNDDQPYDPNRCAAACAATTDYNVQYLGSRAICRFFDTYILLNNSVPMGQYCAMYTASWDSTYATNTGYTDTEGNVYTIEYSYSYSNSTDPETDNCACAVGSSCNTGSTTTSSSSTSNTMSMSLTTSMVSTTTTSTITYSMSTTTSVSSTTPTTAPVTTPSLTSSTTSSGTSSTTSSTTSTTSSSILSTTTTTISSTPTAPSTALSSTPVTTSTTISTTPTTKSSTTMNTTTSTPPSTTASSTKSTATTSSSSLSTKTSTSSTKPTTTSCTTTSTTSTKSCTTTSPSTTTKPTTTSSSTTTTAKTTSTSSKLSTTLSTSTKSTSSPSATPSNCFQITLSCTTSSCSSRILGIDSSNYLSYTAKTPATFYLDSTSTLHAINTTFAHSIAMDNTGQYGYVSFSSSGNQINCSYSGSTGKVSCGAAQMSSKGAWISSGSGAIVVGGNPGASWSSVGLSVNSCSCY